MPNTTSPLSIQSTTYLGGLSSGTYKVVAIQSLNSSQNTKEAQVTIQKNVVPFAFSVSSTNNSCLQGGNLTLSATSGNIASCEIISGPETRQLQTSTTFANLQSGVYNIRAYDDCGIAKVKTFSLSLINAELNISDPTFQENFSAPCDSITVVNTITPSAGVINYPITVQHSMDLVDISGQSIVTQQTFTTGDPASLTVTAVVPRLQDQSYSYELSVTDNCNTIYMKDDNVVNPDLKLVLAVGDAPCAEKFLKITASKFKDSYTVNFISYPDGFDPTLFNVTPQGPFTTAAVDYGSATNPVPFGTYVVQITDACGRTKTESILIEFIKPSPSVGGYNNGCFALFGGINASVPPQKIVTASIIAAPSTYTATLPQDVSSFINPQGTLKVVNLPLGSYTVAFIDECGFDYQKTVTVPVYSDKGLNVAALPSCVAQFGSARFRSGNGDLINAQITQAPVAFGQVLPYDLTPVLTANGELYMANLPEGTYKFLGTDECGVTAEKELNVEGYIAPAVPFIYTPNCGTFNVKVTDDGNGMEGATYWLQKYFPDTNTWGHPQTGGDYTEGEEPATTNAIRLYNNSQKSNLSYSGKFRIIKKFETFSEGTSQNTKCVSVMGEFEYNDVLSVSVAYTMACTGAPRDVVIEYTGNPTSFKIIKKNGAAFNFNNGSSNVFHDLEPAEYVFQIQDDCGNIITQWFNSVDMPSISAAQQPTDMVECGQPGGGTTGQNFNLPSKDAEILGPLYSSLYTITYYLTEIEAEAAENPLPADYANIQNGQQIWARLQHNEIDICHALTSFKLYVGEVQTVAIQTLGTICNEGSVTLTADGGFDDYVWSNGASGQTITVTEPGNYTVEARKNYGNSYCSAFVSSEIIESTTAKITDLEIADWTDDHNAIVVHVEGIGNYEYSIDGINYQTDNTFTNLETGVYKVYVKDINGCGVASQDVALLNYPKFFTPNGDGANEKWHVKYSFKEPDFGVTIFDRYGKLITTINASSAGWDGTLNGIQLPSTDYWFVAKREDGRELRGHFSLIR
ncbi:T9SS type B sorting domain-containing protein [Flavobacterium sp. RHBU_3]|uniref:T9SS type B sorting domain-containing protein n=1 Tax=Flavobacterium sp. RHBU_3 TaxID=3391184 RepID=UPI0039847E9C